MHLNDRQRAQLLRPLNPSRVRQRTQAGRTFSYLTQHDVRAMLIRIFGFGGFSGEVVDTAHLYTHERQPGEGKNTRVMYDVAWRVRYRLTLHTEGYIDPTYTEEAIGSASGPTLADVHDQAIKSAESDAMKRCAVNLGDQFGLSLYEDGSTTAIVRTTLDVDEPAPTEPSGPDRTSTLSGPTPLNPEPKRREKFVSHPTGRNAEQALREPVEGQISLDDPEAVAAIAAAFTDEGGGENAPS